MEREREVGPAPVETGVGGRALDAVLVGPTIYEGPTAFIDIDRLVRTLEGDALTGHVRVEGPGFTGLVLLVAGRVVAARFSDGRMGGIRAIGDALRCLEWRAQRGDGRVTVVGLDSDRAEAATELLTGLALVGGLRGRFADLEALLEYLGEVSVDGTMVVEAGERSAAVLLTAGRVRRTFVAERSVAGRVPVAVRTLAADPAARISVAAGPHWAPGRPPARVPALVLQGRRAARTRRRSAQTATGGGVA
ncbi:MAG: DUF4388 domain-containing protein [Chloroflexi bacterium]|nr:MAG: DUF4388 domain-containing protein [Chloroflexota bacterium]